MRIHALANAGMLVESGKHKILVDALNRRLPPFQGISEETIRAIMLSEPPFEHLNGLIISHDHLDHVDIPVVREFCRRRPDVPVVSTPRVIDMLREGVPGRANLRTVELDLFDGLRLTLGGAEIDFLRLAHAGKEFGAVHNLACALHLDTVLAHTGDSEGDARNIETLRRWLPAGAVVCAPFPYLTLRTTRERLRPLSLSALYLMHLPTPEEDRFGWLKALDRALDREKDLRILIAGEPGTIHTV